MKKYCPVCFREISTSRRGKICRHGFKKNRWIFNGEPKLRNAEYRKVDSSPCRGSGKVGLILIQMKKRKNNVGR